MIMMNALFAMYLKPLFTVDLVSMAKNKLPYII